MKFKKNKYKKYKKWEGQLYLASFFYQHFCLETLQRLSKSWTVCEHPLLMLCLWQRSFGAQHIYSQEQKWAFILSQKHYPQIIFNSAVPCVTLHCFCCTYCVCFFPHCPTPPYTKGTIYLLSLIIVMFTNGKIVLFYYHYIQFGL